MWPQNRQFNQYQNKSLLALDYGKKICGLSRFTPGVDPYPLLFGKILYRNDTQVIQEINKIIERENIDLIILGIPYLTDNSKSSMTIRVEAFYKKLLAKCPVPVKTQDETLSTIEAKGRMRLDPRFNFKVDLQKN